MMLDKIKNSEVYSKIKLLDNQRTSMAEILGEVKSHHQFYIDFLLGFIRNKPNALKEDIRYALDVASFYKDKPEQFEYKSLKPIELGEKKFKEIAKAFNEKIISKNKSKIQKAKQKGKLIDNVTVDVIYEDNEYKLYFIPKLKNDYSKEELNIQHLKFCFVGYGTEWCTAHPSGNYYEDYVTHDIYTLHFKNKPHSQFNLVGEELKEIDQMMDREDEYISVLNPKIISILEKATGKSVDFNKYHLAGKYRQKLEHLSDDDKVKAMFEIELEGDKPIYEKTELELKLVKDIIYYYNLHENKLLGKFAYDKYNKNLLAMSLYLNTILKSRWIEAEPEILKNLLSSDKTEAEFAISFVVTYAEKILKGRWIEAEPNILKNSAFAYLYARHVIKGRWIEAEKSTFSINDINRVLYASEMFGNDYEAYEEFQNAIKTSEIS